MNENFFIEGSAYIPEVNFNAQTGELWISGEAHMEFTFELILPIFEALTKYMGQPNRKINLNFKLTYYGEPFSKRIHEIIKLLEEYQFKKNGEVFINWHYQKNDLNMLESGEELAEDCKIPFHLVQY